MPRSPITLSEDQVREVETLAALLNQDQIADYFGISRTTFQAIRDRDEEVAVRHKRGRAKAIAHVANGLLQKARTGDTTSSIFYLKTQAGWRETHPNDPADTGSDDPLRDLLDHVARQGRRIGPPSVGPRGEGHSLRVSTRDRRGQQNTRKAMIATGGRTGSSDAGD